MINKQDEIFAVTNINNSTEMNQNSGTLGFMDINLFQRNR